MPQKHMPTLLILLLLSLTKPAKTQHDQVYIPDPDPAIEARLEAWKDLKFGLLMHWGPYSQWGVVESWSICPEDLPWATAARKKGVAENEYETYKKAYEALKTTFNPTAFAPEKWAAAAKRAGMKYVVFTTKHHDGFCMFDTRETNYKITDRECPFSAHPRRNVTREIFDAFRKEGFWTGAYFSKPDWNMDAYWWKKFPVADRNCNYQISKYPSMWQKYVDFTHNQIDELMSDYGKIDILWLDGGWVRKTSDEEVKNYLLEKFEGVRYSRNPQNQDIDIERLAKTARKKQPGLLVVDRACPGPYQNYLTPEQHIPEEGLPYPWETCMTMAGSWSHVPNDQYKSSAELIRKLVDIVSKGGNFLLNIGPRPDGEWDDTAYQRLQDIGAWMDVNGEAIYGTRMHDTYGEGDNIRFTRTADGNFVYVFLLGLAEKEIVLQKVSLKPGSVIQVLGSDAAVKWKKEKGGIALYLSEELKENINAVLVLKVPQQP
jgi:alpha-L-fucosidase